MSEEKRKLVFKKPVEPESKPIDDMAAYFAYWEAKRLEDRRNAQRDESCLSVYERARLKYPGSF